MAKRFTEPEFGKDSLNTIPLGESHPSIEGRLMPSEKVVWVGRPRRVSHKDYVFVVLGFTVLSIALLSFIAGGFLASEIDKVLHVRGWARQILLPFGLFVTIFGITLLWPLYALGRTLYLLTTRRVLIRHATLFRHSELQAIFPYEFTDLYVTREKKCCADVVLVRKKMPGAIEGDGIVERGFFGINDAQLVAKLIRVTLSIPDDLASPRSLQ